MKPEDYPAEDNETSMQFQHMAWLKHQTDDMCRMKGNAEIWARLQELRALIPTMRWAAQRVRDAVSFPVEWTGVGKVRHYWSLTTQQWIEMETRELFGEPDQKDARWRAQSLICMAKMMELQIEIQENDICRRWYQEGRSWLAEISPGASQLYLHAAGLITVSECASDLKAAYRCIPEEDAEIYDKASEAEQSSAFPAVRAIFATELRRLDLERVAALRLEIAA